MGAEWRDIFDRDQEKTAFREYDAAELGYGRLGDGWALLIRSRRYVEGPNVNNFPETEAYDDGWEPRPLLGASRKLRLAAVPKIPKLIDLIKAEAERS